MERVIAIIQPEEYSTTVETINGKMNERFATIKRNNPRGFLDQFDQQLEVICCDIAQDLGGQFALRDGKTSDGKPCDELLFIFGMPIEQAEELASNSQRREMMNEREELNALSDTELVAYWNILQTPGIKVDDGKTERHISIVSGLLTERNIPHEKGKRTVESQSSGHESKAGRFSVSKEVTDGSLDHLIYDEESPRSAGNNPDPYGLPNLNIAAANDINGTP